MPSLAPDATEASWFHDTSSRRVHIGTNQIRGYGSHALFPWTLRRRPGAEPRAIQTSAEGRQPVWARIVGHEIRLGAMIYAAKALEEYGARLKGGVTYFS
jgi:hypothetical protein